MAARKSVTAIISAGTLAILAAVVIEATAGTRRDSAETQAQPMTPAAEIEKLITQFGSQRYATREEATRAVVKVGLAAVPFLQNALYSKDPEVKRRASWVLDKVNRTHNEQLIQRLLAEGIDQYVERLVMKQRRITERDWADLAMLGQRASFTGVPSGPRGFVPSQIFLERRVLHTRRFDRVVADELNIKEFKEIRCARIVAGSVIANGSQESFIISNGPAHTDGDLGMCVLFANGKVTVKGWVTGSVIVCDGVLDMPLGMLGNSVVIARGPVVLGECRECTVLAEGPVTVPVCEDSDIYAHGIVTVTERARNSILCGKGSMAVEMCSKCVLRAEGAVTVKTNRGDNIIEQNKPHEWPQVPFKFFDPARLGIQVALAGGDLRVIAVQAEKPFGHAGLKAGDVIVAMDKTKPTSTEAFRRLLRRRELEGRTTLSVRREERTLEVVVTFPAQEKQ
jgi:hypothetical protein